MQTPKRDISAVALPPALIFTSALTCGVLAALALQIYLGQAGFDLATLGQNLLGAGTRQLRTTGPWWAIAGLAFVTGGIAPCGGLQAPSSCCCSRISAIPLPAPRRWVPAPTWRSRWRRSLSPRCLRRSGLISRCGASPVTLLWRLSTI